jgi:hypothetical protein
MRLSDPVITALNLFGPGSRVLALPSWRAPRLLLPAGNAATRWRTSAFYPAHRLRARLVRFMLRAVAMAGGPVQRRVPDTASPLLDHICTFWPDAATFAVQPSQSKQAHTWTAEVRDRSGVILGYVKGGADLEAVRRLTAEADVLPYVPNGRGPRVEWAGVWAGNFIVVTTPLIGSALYPEAPVPADLAPFADALIVGPPQPLDAHPFVAELPRHKPIVDALDALSGRPWPVVLQHGDCAPWNLSRGPDGLAAFDWEFGNRQALPYLDEAYFVLHTGFHVFRRKPEAAVGEAVRYLESRGLSRAEAHAIVILTAFDAWQRTHATGTRSRLQSWRRRVWEGSAGIAEAAHPPAGRLPFLTRSTTPDYQPA